MYFLSQYKHNKHANAAMKELLEQNKVVYCLYCEVAIGLKLSILYVVSLVRFLSFNHMPALILIVFFKEMC